MATALVLALAGCATSGVGMERSEGVRVARSQPLVQSRPLALLASAMRVAPETVARSAAEPRMLRASLRIPAIRMGVVQVVPYRGLPDDGPGTRIQNGGIAASPFGNDGGVGPGQVGNYIVTAHRTTTPAPFADLPALDRGARPRHRGWADFRLSGDRDEIDVVPLEAFPRASGSGRAGAPEDGCASTSSLVADNWRQFYRGEADRSDINKRIERTYGLPGQSPKFWRAASPRPYFDRVTKPVLLHHGTADDTCPINWSRATLRALQDAGKQARLITYEGEGHTMYAQWQRSIEATTAFFDRHLR